MISSLLFGLLVDLYRCFGAEMKACQTFLTVMLPLWFTLLEFNVIYRADFFTNATGITFIIQIEFLVYCG